MKSRLHWRRHILLVPAFVLMFATEPAFTQSATPATADLQARIEAAGAALGSIPKFKRLPAKDRQQLAEFVAGYMLFVLLHEMAHATTTQLGLPLLGKNEDAADSFAVTRLIRLGSGFYGSRVLVESGKGFFLAARRDTKTGDPVPFYDEHGLDEQRGYDVVCLMVGSGQDRYQHLADETNLPKGPPEKSVRRRFHRRVEAPGTWC